MKPKYAIQLTALWLLLMAAVLISRPLLPIDETRYLGVAWEMWHNDSFLVPRINGMPYSHKPPLFFYLIHLGWHVFGVQQWSARLTAPVCSLLSLLLTALLARRLWPGPNRIGDRAPFILLSMPLWTVVSTLTMFDMPLCFFCLAALAGLLRAGRKPASAGGWVLMALGIGAGLLTKGPVILALTVPPGMLAPWWLRGEAKTPSWWRWYLCYLATLGAGIGMALLWAMPAARAGGEEYSKAILWGQTAGRLVKSFAHRRPLWWYLPFIPVVMLPWTLRLPAFTRFVFRDSDTGTRFCLSWLIPSFIVLSFTSGKQIYYLIPLLPAAALLLSRFLENTGRRQTGLEPKTMAAIFTAIGTGLLVLWLLPKSLTSHLSFAAFGPVWGLAFVTTGAAAMFIPPGRGIQPAIRACSMMMLFIALLHICIFSRLAPIYNVVPMAEEIAAQQQNGCEVAVYPEEYANQFHFSGRLDRTTGIENMQELQEWTAAHPDGAVVFVSCPLPAVGKLAPLYVHPFRGHMVSLWRASALLQQLFPNRNQEEHAYPDASP